MLPTFKYLRPRRIGPVHALVSDIGPGTGRSRHTRGAWRKMSKKAIHGITSGPRWKSSRDLRAAQIMVARTLVGPRGTGHVRPQEPFLNIRHIRVLLGRRPIHDIHNPGAIVRVECLGLHIICFGNAEIIDAPVMVVSRVHLPGFAQLVSIIHALNALGLNFSLAQSRQQHRRQDGDNGDHDQQFDQGKSVGGSNPCPRVIGIFHFRRVVHENIEYAQSRSCTSSKCNRHSRHPVAEPSPMSMWQLRR